MHKDSFLYTSDQIELYQNIKVFFEKSMNYDIAKFDKENIFPREAWNKCGNFGMFKLPLPSQWDGFDYDILTLVHAMEAFGYYCHDNGLILAVNSQLWSCEIPILNFGTAIQKTKYLPGLSDGSLIGAHAMTEPNAGSDAASIKTTASKQNGKYILNGGKVFITNAPVADVIIVFAKTSMTKGMFGISAFIIENGTPGFHKGKNLELMGMCTCPVGELFFDNCELDDSNRLGPEGSGWAIFNNEMTWERICLFSCHLGTMKRILDSCLDYTSKRKQFNKQLHEFQSISHLIAGIAVRIETAEAMLYRVASMAKHDLDIIKETAIAKLFISEAFVKTCQDAVRIFGGYGYSVEYGLERMLRDAQASVIYSGTSEIQKNSIFELIKM